MYSKKYILLFMISYIKVVICSKFPTFVVESTTICGEEQNVKSKTYLL